MFTELPGALVQGMLGGVHMENSVESVAPAPAPAPLSAQPFGEHFDALPQERLADDVVMGFTRNGVITPRGVLRVGDMMIFEGESGEITDISFSDSTVFFSNGKRYRK